MHAETAPTNSAASAAMSSPAQMEPASTCASCACSKAASGSKRCCNRPPHRSCPTRTSSSRYWVKRSPARPAATSPCARPRRDVVLQNLPWEILGPACHYVGGHLSPLTVRCFKGVATSGARLCFVPRIVPTPRVLPSTQADPAPVQLAQVADTDADAKLAPRPSLLFVP